MIAWGEGLSREERESSTENKITPDTVTIEANFSMFASKTQTLAAELATRTIIISNLFVFWNFWKFEDKLLGKTTFVARNFKKPARTLPCKLAICWISSYLRSVKYFPEANVLSSASYKELGHSSVNRWSWEMLAKGQQWIFKIWPIFFTILNRYFKIFRSQRKE